MALMFVGLVMLWGLHAASSKADATSDHLAKATFTGNQILERLRAQDFDSINNGSQNQGIYRIEWTVTTPQSWRKDISVTVGWFGNGCSSSVSNCTHRIQLSTIVIEE